MRELQRELQRPRAPATRKRFERPGSERLGGRSRNSRAAFAVRSLRVLGTNLDLHSFGDGLTDNIAGALSQFPYLSVAARAASRRNAGCTFSTAASSRREIFCASPCSSSIWITASNCGPTSTSVRLQLRMSSRCRSDLHGPRGGSDRRCLRRLGAI